MSEQSSIPELHRRAVAGRTPPLRVRPNEARRAASGVPGIAAYRNQNVTFRRGPKTRRGRWIRDHSDMPHRRQRTEVVTVRSAWNASVRVHRAWLPAGRIHALATRSPSPRFPKRADKSIPSHPAVPRQAAIRPRTRPNGTASGFLSMRPRRTAPSHLVVSCNRQSAGKPSTQHPLSGGPPCIVAMPERYAATSAWSMRRFASNMAATMFSRSRSSRASRIWSNGVPFAGSSGTSATRIRSRRMLGRPPHRSGSKVMRLAVPDLAHSRPRTDAGTLTVIRARAVGSKPTAGNRPPELPPAPISHASCRLPQHVRGEPEGPGQVRVLAGKPTARALQCGRGGSAPEADPGAIRPAPAAMAPPRPEHSCPASRPQCEFSHKLISRFQRR